MRTIAKVILALAFIGAMAVGVIYPAKAQYYYPPPPPPPPYYYGGGYPPPPPPPYGYYRYGRTVDGCPPRYTRQGGVCKPYRGY